NLMLSIKKALHIKIDRIQAYTDSTVTLGWIRSPPARWKTFVANLVSEIQSILPAELWNYVPSEENPADVASRGIGPSDLLSHPLSAPDPDVTHLNPSRLDRWQLLQQ